MRTSRPNCCLWSFPVGRGHTFFFVAQGGYLRCGLYIFNKKCPGHKQEVPSTVNLKRKRRGCQKTKQQWKCNISEQHQTRRRQARREYVGRTISPLPDNWRGRFSRTVPYKLLLVPQGCQFMSPRWGRIRLGWPLLRLPEGYGGAAGGFRPIQLGKGDKASSPCAEGELGAST